MACSASPVPLLPVGLFPGRGTGQEGKVLHRAGHTTLATHTLLECTEDMQKNCYLFLGHSDGGKGPEFHLL